METRNGIREIEKLVTAHKQREGGGFIVRRPFPGLGFSAVDPFLLLDEMGPVDYAPGEAVGAPDHPHRGFETVTYVLAGEMEHEDSAGHRGSLRAGDVQWMTAGAGIIHAEMPSSALRDKGGRVHGFQVWVNLPARLKLTTPRYQEIAADAIPRAQTSDGRARVRVVAGEALGVRAVIDTHTPIVYQDWSLDAGGDVTVTVGRDHQALVYVFEGNLLVGDRDGGRPISDGQMALLGAGDSVRLRGAPGGGRALLLAGVPLNEPIARYGPFVMNNDAELVAAFQDYQSGRMGEITRTAKVG
ncbi:MAG TPA: pirin family protein [Polyangia bacterium]|jgi:redox-sensitive bicupin YhaK (pirin superfamily)|nr:pirin family protein [Polyangia bacterium]